MDAAGHALITGFGLTGIAQNTDSMRRDSCLLDHITRWTAPEILKAGTYSKEADVFSFAMVMIEVRYERVIYVEL